MYVVQSTSNTLRIAKVERDTKKLDLHNFEGKSNNNNE